MNKALNVVGRILIFCVGEVSMYFAMTDPVVHIMLGDDINAPRLLISWAALILTAIIDDNALPVSITTRATMSTSNKFLEVTHHDRTESNR